MRKKQGMEDQLTAFGFLSPWVIGFLLFTGGPIIASFVLSLTKWNLLGNPSFVGFANYQELFSPSSTFYNTLKATFIFTLLNVGITVFWSLFLAILLNFKLRFMKVFQFFFFVPAVMPSVVMASCFILMFNNELGIVNYLLSYIGVDGPNWLGNTNLVWVVVGMMSVFTFSTGQMMLIFNSSLKEVPIERYEAASLDGANAWQRFIHVTLPSISPILLFNTIVATVNSFNGAFTIIYPLTGGGPGDVTKVLSLEIYEKAFKQFDMGMASTLAFILFIIVGLISIFQFKFGDKKVNYG
ncbi:sugar ABC transporter permease [uncultured Vagococcus sp.]|uniref:carbohydrate ABC transporter permease n=1 Tax=uncultured Vagococcus sp. TaxID=189676 RepID=UPI0028D04E3D|nr:sugar ABC transporter permease [uncultured Vagococcus sp.]